MKRRVFTSAAEKAGRCGRAATAAPATPPKALRPNSRRVNWSGITASGAEGTAMRRSKIRAGDRALFLSGRSGRLVLMTVGVTPGRQLAHRRLLRCAARKSEGEAGAEAAARWRVGRPRLGQSPFSGRG